VFGRAKPGHDDAVLRDMDASDIILKTEGLTKSFKGFVAVNGVDLAVRRGTIHALIGPNGAGKTTVFNLLTKFLAPTAGRITYDGRDITALKPAQIARLGIVRSFQISAVFASLTVRQNVRIALQRFRPDGFFFWRSARALDEMNQRVATLLADVGLEGQLDRRAGDLPYGQRRALEVATTLALSPELVLLDEPTSGLGQEDIGRIAELIRKSSKDRTTVMVEHNLSVVADLSDHITVLARGEILADGVYKDVASDPRVIEAYMGSSHA
jgi:branched-chain amino acid transport system ATP-binding protein